MLKSYLTTIFHSLVGRFYWEYDMEEFELLEYAGQYLRPTSKAFLGYAKLLAKPDLTNEERIYLVELLEKKAEQLDQFTDHLLTDINRLRGSTS